MPLINMDYYLLLKKQQLNFEIIIPFHGYKFELQRELEHYHLVYYYIDDKIALIEPTQHRFIWAQDHWKNIKYFDLEADLKTAFQTLKSLPILGYLFKTNTDKTQLNLHKHFENRFSQLKLIPQKRITFNPDKKFNFKYFIFTFHKNYLFYSDSPSARYPAGWNEFNEDKSTPPNRAYLKLWETISVENLYFDKNTEALEIGASPGGWSWVLSHYFKKVHTFDRADLDPKVASIKNIEHHIGDAFKINPIDYPHVSWFFSDLICTPEKIYETIELWLNQSRVQNFVCTIKFKGECNFEIIDKLLKIPHSKIIKLYQNKHEVTWIRQTPSEVNK